MSHTGIALRAPRIDIETARRAMTAMTLLTAAAVLALHIPGHVSMDTSIQLYEAFTGISVSWNPPFMSALMRWTGGGEVATSVLVGANVVLLYGAFLLVGDCLLRARLHRGEATISVWAPVLACIVILNPIVALYAGIVWKDVLFGALLAAGGALSIAALHARAVARVLYTAMAVIVLAAALLTRQQGVFMAPVLLLILLLDRDRWSVAWRWLIIIAVFAGTAGLLQHKVAATVRNSGVRSTSIGFRSIMIFDMMGIVARSSRTASELAWPISAEEKEAVRRVYQPSRIDYIANDPVAEGWVTKIDPMLLKSAWWALVKQDPAGYLGHRALAFATLLGLRGVDQTQPIAIGVEGNPEYLRAVGLHEGRGPRDLLIYRIASSLFGWPVYRHAFWLMVLVGCAATLARRKLWSPLRRSALCLVAACALFYASYLPTTISSDFRYLFGALPLIGLLVLILAFGMEPMEPEA